MTSPLDHFDHLPPFLCVAVARVNRRRKTLVEISIESGIGIRTVRRIAARPTWGHVKLGVALRFAAACGVDLVNQSKTRRYLRGSTARDNVLPHLTDRQLARFVELFKARQTRTSMT